LKKVADNKPPDSIAESFGRMHNTLRYFAFDALDAVVGMDTLKDSLTRFSKKLAGSEGQFKEFLANHPQIAKLAADVIGLGIVIGPAFSGIGQAAQSLESMLNLMPMLAKGFAFLGGTISAAFWPLIAASAAIYAAYKLYKMVISGDIYGGKTNAVKGFAEMAHYSMHPVEGYKDIKSGKLGIYQDPNMHFSFAELMKNLKQMVGITVTVNQDGKVTGVNTTTTSGTGLNRGFSNAPAR
jgi:hypothetical protein